MQKPRQSVQNRRTTDAGFEYDPQFMPPDFPLWMLHNDRPGGDMKKGLYHFHDDLEIGLCLSGKGTFYIEDRELGFRPGDVFVIGPGLLHRAISEPGHESRWTWMFPYLSRLLGSRVDNPDLLDTAPYAMISSPVLRMQKKNHPRLYDLVKELSDLHARKGSPDAIRALVVLILTYLRPIALSPDAGFREAAGNPSGLQRIKPALGLINTGYGKKLPIEQMAQACFMSVRHFTTMFQTIMHEMPHEYLTRFRISRACGLLGSSTESINQIALGCGFESLSSFNRSFKRMTGVAPKEYRAGGKRPATNIHS
jgi:AraC-like DNA-binding protein